MPTDEQWAKLVRIVKKKFAEYDQAIEDLWLKVNDDSEIKYVDEIAEDLKKEHRRITRLEKRVEELENAEQTEEVT